VFLPLPSHGFIPNLYFEFPLAQTIQMEGRHSYNRLYDISLSAHAVRGLLHFILASAADHLLFTHLSAPFPFQAFVVLLTAFYRESSGL